MGFVEVAHVDVFLPDGRRLLADACLRASGPSVTALVGPNGTGKTTLLRLVAGDLSPDSGTVQVDGRLGVMPQFVGSIRDQRTVRELLVGLSPPALRGAGETLAAAERARRDHPGQASDLAYAVAINDWGDAGGFAAEAGWDSCAQAALRRPYDHVASRRVKTLSGGEQKRLVLEMLLRGEAEVLVLDEPDNYLDVPTKAWLEDQLRASQQTILLVSHDRELLNQAADRIVGLEPSPAGAETWTHGGGFASFHQARAARFERYDELRRRWDDQRAKLKRLVADLQQYAKRSDAMASRYQAAQTRLAKFEQAGPPPQPPAPQKITMRLKGGRTGVRALTCQGLALHTGPERGRRLTRPFDLEVFFGQRVALLGANGVGKSHFLRLLAGEPVERTGTWRLGARVLPGYFAQTHAHPELAGRRLLEVLSRDHALDRGAALSALRRYELSRAAEQSFDSLSGGQQARFQILLLELGGATMLLLDEPTDNLDLESAEALQLALDQFEGTVLAVTHDRWFARGFDRYLAFGADGRLRETTEPVWQ
ncbi:MAG: ATP-binding cassette domain-containing protein [Propionibacteriaceae bacterium]|jgi:ATPase subunit of ABC transporter with duplicated ATPase domains|nr:ATP-binding cassette domain-containing protein [Propionibacteriaceae bacterium]